MEDFLRTYWLDMLTTLLGLIYIALEYRASIWLWLVGIIMPAMDVVLYWQHSLYGDAGMAVYYTLAAIYGWLVWTFGRKKRQAPGQKLPITRMRAGLYGPVFLAFLAIWGATYYLLVHFTDSTVPLLDAFTNALSFVGLWALARKYVEQWLFWIVVDVISAYLYVVKFIPFKAGLYTLYVVVAVLGYLKWEKMMHREQSVDTASV